MSARALTWAWDQMPALSSTPQRLVLVALADRADDDGELFPKVSWVADKVGLGKSTVRRHIAALEESGLLIREEQTRANGSQTSNLLRLAIDTPRSVPSATPPETERGAPPESGRPGDDHEGDDHFNKAIAGVWDYWLGARQPKVKGLARGTAQQIARALNAGFDAQDLCLAIDGLLASDWHREHGKLQLSTIFQTGPGTQSFEDRIQSFIDKAPNAHSRQPNGGGRGLPPWVRAALIASRNHHTARWDAKSRLWMTDQQAINNAASEAVMYAAGRNRRVEWTGDDHRTLELQLVVGGDG